jgi:hypothetical protein
MPKLKYLYRVLSILIFIVLVLKTWYTYFGTFVYRTTAGLFKVYFQNFHLTTRLRWPPIVWHQRNVLCLHNPTYLYTCSYCSIFCLQGNTVYIHGEWFIHVHINNWLIRSWNLLYIFICFVYHIYMQYILFCILENIYTEKKIKELISFI